jgi:hypothetical protein
MSGERLIAAAGHSPAQQETALVVRPVAIRLPWLPILPVKRTTWSSTG